ncbi:MAG: hypothetical protein P4L92_16750 [Rudaea sp.]|nr:hypothetical protein [Rudaea sp.]
MALLTQLWLPILLSTVFVFFASAILNMVLKFWHTPDYHGFSNEDEVGAAIRKGNPAPGMYMLPYCTPEAMKKAETQEKFKTGPVGMLALRQPGAMNMGASLGQWFAFCLVVSLLCALLVAHALANGSGFARVFHMVALAAFMGYALGPIPNSIWWGHSWSVTVKHVVDGLIYAVITGATFAWLWPA